VGSAILSRVQAAASGLGGIVLVLAMGACDGSALPTAASRAPHVHPPSSGEVLSEPVPTEDELLVRAASCEYQTRCIPEGMGMYPGGDLAGCLDVPFCKGASITRSSVVDFEACLEVLRSGSCTATIFPGGQVLDLESSSPCAAKPFDLTEYYEGKPERGEACLGGTGFDEFACAAGSWCKLEVPARQAGNSFCGTCSAFLEPGGSCTEDDRCAGLARCFEGVCREALADGEACSGADQCLNWTCRNGECVDPYDTSSIAINYGELLGAPCSHTFECGPDPTLNCIGGVCVPTPGRGEPCESLDDCRVGLGCHEGLCEDVPCRVEFGGFCGKFQGTCATANAYCDATGHCAELPGEGETCGDFMVCAFPLECDPDTQRCRTPPPPLPVGAPCIYASLGFGRGVSHCESGSICQRDVRPYCDVTAQGASCLIPDCDTECGVCTLSPEATSCR
jgi:hypothetical protein